MTTHADMQPVAAEQIYDRGAGVRGFEAADYSCEASACDGQKLEAGGGGAKAPLAPRFRRPCIQL